MWCSVTESNRSLLDLHMAQQTAARDDSLSVDFVRTFGLGNNFTVPQ